MHRPTLLCLILTTLGPIAARGAAPTRPEGVSSADPRTPEEEQKGFHLPEGFVIELVAAEPEIRKPLNLAFDDRGRLWVTETVEYPYPAAEGTTPRDGVKVLADFGPDGRARSIRTFADGLNIPIGILPLPGGDSALVHSIPNVSRLSDDDRDGVADRREVLYSTFGSKDTHGMTNAFTWGFDGWIYACHGFSNSSTVEGSDRMSVAMQSGNVYRMRPDGSHLELYSHGQVNPFGLAFDPLGNLYSCDCHSRPIYQLLRGGWYPSFGKPHDGLGFAPEMLTHDHGSTAISGICYYAADGFPESLRGTVFIGNVMTNRINHDRIEWHGSTPRAIAQPDFLRSDDNWFRPVDIELGPDGALYVADFYNRIIGHYEVPLTHPGRDRDRGRIWRIVYRGPEGKTRAERVASKGDGATADREALVADLGHPNLGVRLIAANELSRRPPDHSLKAIATADGDTWRRVHALWVLQRQGILDEETLKASAGDRSTAVRGHVQRVLGESPALAGALHELVLRGLKDEDAQVRRNAAEALGRHPDPSHIRPLLELRQQASKDDTHLIHVARMALRDQMRADSAWEYVAGIDLVEREAQDLADVALGVPTAASSRFLLQQIRRLPASQALQVAWVHHIARYGGDGTGHDLTAFIAEHHDSGLARQASLLKASRQGAQERGGSSGADSRELALLVSRALLDSEKSDEVRTGIQLAGTFELAELQGRLVSLARDRTTGTEDATRAVAMSTLTAIAPGPAISTLSQILADPADPVAIREQAAASLGAVAQPGAQEALMVVLATAPGRLQSAIAAALAPRPAGAGALLDAIAAGKAPARVLQEPKVVASLAQAKLPDLQARLDPLLKGLPTGDRRLRDLLNRRRQRFETTARDPAKGALVFEKNCMACHQFRSQGSRIGPQLDGIGARGVDRLLEDILDPNLNVDQAFRTSNLFLKDGRLVAGLLLREEGKVIVLADSQGKEVRITRDEVDDQSFSQISPMPANFADQITEDDFYSLLEYLMAAQAREPT